MDFLYGNRPNQSLFQDHVHTNTAGADVLGDNILSSVYNMLGLSDRMSHYEKKSIGEDNGEENCTIQGISRAQKFISSKVPLLKENSNDCRAANHDLIVCQIITISILFICIAIFLLEHKSKSPQYINPFIFQGKSLNICHLNINHILPRFFELQCLLSEAKSNTHIICFSETLLSDSVKNKEINVQGYTIHRRDRIGKLGGGELLIYSSKELNTIRRDDIEMQEMEAIWIELVNNYRQPLLIGYMHRPPNSRAEWVNKFETMLLKVDTEDKELIILGDLTLI